MPRTTHYPFDPARGYAIVSPLPRAIQREDSEIICMNDGCLGIMKEVAATKDEIKKQTCGRPYACCIAVFVCDKCKMRALFDLPAPECNW